MARTKPASITTIRSAIVTVESLCAITITVVSAATSAMVARNAASLTASSCEVASSSRPMGLSPVGARALLQLDPDAPMPTRFLAERLSCDPSNVTAFVDRLEDSGLVERRVEAHDRRIKTLVMTDKGRRVRAQMITIIATETSSLLGLTPDEQQTLLELLDKAWQACLARNAAR